MPAFSSSLLAASTAGVSTSRRRFDGLCFRPVDVVDRLAPRALLVITVADDTVTPDEQATALYERAGAPKRLLRQHGTTHYESYTENFEILAREIVDWYDEHLTGSLIEIVEDRP